MWFCPGAFLHWAFGFFRGAACCVATRQLLYEVLQSRLLLICWTDIFSLRIPPIFCFGPRLGTSKGKKSTYDSVRRVSNDSKHAHHTFLCDIMTTYLFDSLRKIYSIWVHKNKKKSDCSANVKINSNTIQRLKILMIELFLLGAPGTKNSDFILKLCDIAAKNSRFLTLVWGVHVYESY